MQNIAENTDFDNSDESPDNTIPPKYNRSWGTDYILMDSKNFMGKKGEPDYTQIIDMYQKLWDTYNYRLFSVF